MEATSTKLICRYCGGVNDRPSKACFHCARSLKTGGSNSFIKDVPNTLLTDHKELFWNAEKQQFQTKAHSKSTVEESSSQPTSTLENSPFEKCDLCRFQCTVETGCQRFGKKVTKVFLKVEGKTADFSFDITESKKIVIGRSITPWEEVLDLSISKIHCVIKYENAQFIIQEDHASTNGTFVNHQRLVNQQSMVLKSGDVITLGNKRFVFHVN